MMVTYRYGENKIGQPTIVSRPIEAIIITVISISTGSISELNSKSIRV